MRRIPALIAFLILTLLVVVGQTRRHAAPGTQQSTLSIKAGVIFKSGDVKPAARITFYLLDEDLKTILDRIYSPPETFERNLEKMDLIASMAGDEANAQEEIRKHTVAKTTTDFSGNARFNALKGGGRFLFGMFRTDYTTVAWHLPIQLRPGPQSITLDNKNAVYIQNR